MHIVQGEVSRLAFHKGRKIVLFHFASISCVFFGLSFLSCYSLLLLMVLLVYFLFCFVVLFLIFRCKLPCTPARVDRQDKRGFSPQINKSRPEPCGKCAADQFPCVNFSTTCVAGMGIWHSGKTQAESLVSTD